MMLFKGAVKKVNPCSDQLSFQRSLLSKSHRGGGFRPVFNLKNRTDGSGQSISRWNLYNWQKSSSGKGFHDHHRFEGRVFYDSDTLRGQKIPSVRMGRESSRISSSSIRVNHGTQGVYKGHEAGNSALKTKINVSNHISRRQRSMRVIIYLDDLILFAAQNKRA